VRCWRAKARTIPHKGGAALGYRVSDGSRAIAYLPDHCPTVAGPGPEGWGAYHRDALDLAAGADVLIHDAFLMPGEVASDDDLDRLAARVATSTGTGAPGAPPDVNVAAEGQVIEL
jgi:hypothetical protein